MILKALFRLKFLTLLISFINCLPATNHESNSVHIEHEYHSYDQMTQLLKIYAQAYPEKAYLYSIGQTVEHRELWVMAISDMKPNVHIELRPEVKYVGNMHGNQAPSREILLHFIDVLLKNQSTNQDIDYLLKNVRVHVLVSMNPDGAERAIPNMCSSKIGRNNTNGYDLNRNFPDMYFCNDAPIQPETSALINWMEKNTFILSANFHTGAVVTSYGYDNFPNSAGAKGPQKNPTDDNDVLHEIALRYSSNNYKMPHYICDGESFPDGTTNGASWFPPVRGGMQDFNYWKYGCIEETVEFYCCMHPPASELNEIWLQNEKSLIEYLKMANTGIRGFIKYHNGQPAKNIAIKFDNREPIFRSNDHGEYFRILLPGEYNLTLMLDCNNIIYQTKIHVPEDTHLLILNIILEDEYIEKATKLATSKYPLFCSHSKAPVDCTSTHSEPNHDDHGADSTSHGQNNTEHSNHGDAHNTHDNNHADDQHPTDQHSHDSHSNDQHSTDDHHEHEPSSNHVPQNSTDVENGANRLINGLTLIYFCICFITFNILV